MRAWELAARLAIEGEFLRDSQARFMALGQCTNDDTLLRTIEAAEKCAANAANWTEMAAREAYNQARQQEKLTEQLEKSVAVPVKERL